MTRTTGTPRKKYGYLLTLSCRLGLALGVTGSAYHTGQHALGLLSHSRVNTDPAESGHGRLIPDFF